MAISVYRYSVTSVHLEYRHFLIRARDSLIGRESHLAPHPALWHGSSLFFLLVTHVRLLRRQSADWRISPEVGSPDVTWRHGASYFRELESLCRKPGRQRACLCFARSPTWSLLKVKKHRRKGLKTQKEMFIV